MGKLKRRFIQMILALVVVERNIKSVVVGENVMMSYEEYELRCQKQMQRNANFLEIFEKDLLSTGLSANTVRKHFSNVDFYINTYLLREEPLDMERGCIKIDMFLGYFFIHKCMWSTPGNIKTTAASIKKYYKCMLNHGYVDKGNYELLCSEIKEHIEEWQEECARFNSEYGYY
ncbi:MAG: hypothetical protein ACI4TK_02660 [Agathobacter sp.]